MDYIIAGVITLILLMVVAVSALYRWEYGLVISLASFALVNRLKTEYYINLQYIVITAETIFIILLFWAWRVRVNRRLAPTQLKSYLVGPLMLLLASTMLSLFNSYDIRISLRLLMAGVIEPVILYYLIINNIKNINQVKLMIYALIVSATIATVYGVWQVLLTVRGTGNAFDYRIVSVFYSPAIFGEILLLSFPLVVISRISLKRSQKIYGWLLDIALGGMIVALLLTITRGVWVGLVAALIVLSFSREVRSYFLTRVPMVLLLLIILAVQSGIISELSALSELFQRRPATLADFGDRTSSIGERIFAWETALFVMIPHNPIGIGMGMFPRVWPVYRPYSEGLDAAHNLLLDIGVEMGVMGLFAFVLIILNALRTSLRLYRFSIDSYARQLGLGILACLSGYLVAAVVGGAQLAHNVHNVADPLGSPIATGMLIFWTLLGCLYVLKRIDSREPSESQSLSSH